MTQDSDLHYVFVSLVFKAFLVALAAGVIATLIAGALGNISISLPAALQGVA